AVGVQIDVVGDVLQVGGAGVGVGVVLHDLGVVLGGGGELVLGAVDLHGAGSALAVSSVLVTRAGLEGLDLGAGDDLSGGHSLDLAVGHGDQIGIVSQNVLY